MLAEDASLSQQLRMFLALKQDLIGIALLNKTLKTWLSQEMDCAFNAQLVLSGDPNP